MPMKKHPNCDFSYAGLKTSVRLAIEAEQRRYGADDCRGHPGVVQGQEGGASDRDSSSSTLSAAQTNISDPEGFIQV